MHVRTRVRRKGQSEDDKAQSRSATHLNRSDDRDKDYQQSYKNGQPFQSLALVDYSLRY